MTGRFAFLLLAAALLPLPAAAARLESGDLHLPPGARQAGDLYFGGNSLRLEGPVDGSVVAGAQMISISGPVAGNIFAGAQSVGVAGPVQGDIVACCATLDLSAPVRGAVRAGAATIVVADTVARDLVVGCRDLTITRDGVILGDVIAGCDRLTIDGIVRGSVRTAADEVTVSGMVDGDLRAVVGERLYLAEDARIFGSLHYRSEHELDLGHPDAVFGQTVFTPIEKPDELSRLGRARPGPGVLFAFLLPFAILSVLGALVTGFILIAVWKHALLHALENALSRFGRTVGFGALGLFATPAAIVVALLLIVTIPAGLVAGLLYLVALYLAKTLAGMFLGRWLFRLFGGRTASIWLTAPVGILLVYALCTIPVFGWVVWLFALIIGFGVLLELIGMSRRPQ